MFSGLTRGDSSIKQTYLRQKVKEGSSIKVDSNAMGEENYGDILQRVDTRLSLQIAPSADFDEKAIVGDDDDQVGVLQLHDNEIQDPKELQDYLKEEISRLNVMNESLSSRLDEVTNKFKTLKKEYLNLILQRPVDQQRATNIHPIKTLNNYEAIHSRVKLHGGESSDSKQITVDIDDDEDYMSNNPDLCDTIVNRDDEHLIKCQKTEDDNANRGKNNITPWQRVGGAGMSPPTADVEENHEVTMRRARVSVRIRSEENMISDGCQWRKYGQKLSKGNPCPRAYYRCTMGSSCPVRKQVQRCGEDTSILTTTYEGHHNHALPTAAKAMASTTSAAASMLIAGSKSSSPFDGYLSTPIFTQPTALPGLPSLATISASAPFPTITLDLTQPQEMNNTTSSNTNGQDFIGIMQNLLSQPPNNFQTPNDPNKEGSNWSLIDLLSITKAALALDPNLASALATAISSVMKASFESDNVKHNTKDDNSNMTNFDAK